MSEMDDAAVVRQCLEGNTALFGTLIDRYQKPLFNTALRMTGDYEEARDIAQTVFVKAYMKLDTYRAEHKFFSWIYRMLVNESIGYLKQRKNYQALSPDILSDGKTPEEEHQSHEVSNTIQEALIELQFDYRLVIVLRYFNDMTYSEMSQVLEIPEKTVKSRLYSARQLLAKSLQQKGIESHG
jgi:RNA polymerase sigma-70 factor (ECF subfamily)